MSKHHEIKMHLVGGTDVVADAAPYMHIGDTVCYSSADGKVRVVFPAGTPYDVSEIHDGNSHKVKTLGRFGFQCFITPTGKTEEVGWSPKNPKAGGEHDVIPGP